MLAGFSFEKRYYLYSWLASNTDDSSKIIYSKKPFYPTGNEIRGALYLQAQHELTRWLKLDFGARFDMAQKFKSAFNPRVAFIVSPMKRLTIKLIYTEAFQAPGYSYRTSNADYSGSIGNLEPENLTTYQGSVRYNNGLLSYIEATVYYNRLGNLITRTDQNYYANFGRLASYGIELDMRQQLNPFTIFANYSLLLPDTNYMDEAFIAKNIFNNSFRHFPKHSANAGAYYSYKNLLNISFYGQYASGFQSVQNHTAKTRLNCNASILVSNIKNTSVSLSFYNIFNRQYKLGDPSVIPLEQPGRWSMLSVSFELNNKTRVVK